MPAALPLSPSLAKSLNGAPFAPMDTMGPIAPNGAGGGLIPRTPLTHTLAAGGAYYTDSYNGGIVKNYASRSNGTLYELTPQQVSAADAAYQAKVNPPPAPKPVVTLAPSKGYYKEVAPSGATTYYYFGSGGKRYDISAGDAAKIDAAAAAPQSSKPATPLQSDTAAAFANSLASLGQVYSYGTGQYSNVPPNSDPYGSTYAPGYASGSGDTNVAAAVPWIAGIDNSTVVLAAASLLAAYLMK